MTTMPTLTVEIAFASDALNTAPTFTDITTFVRSGSIKTGRSNELDEFQTGSCTLTLDNRARTFDPLYAAGPYYGNLKARRQLRVRAVYASVTYDLFYGFVSGWGVAPDVSGDSVWQIEAFDGLSYLAQFDLPQDVFTYQVENLSGADPIAWLPFGSAVQDLSDRYQTYPFAFTTTEPKTGGAGSAWLTGSSQTFDGTYGAIGSAIPSSTNGSVAFLFKTDNFGFSGTLLNPIVSSASPTNPMCIGIDASGRLAYRRGTAGTAHSGLVAADNLWHQGVVTWDGTNPPNVYVDGYLLSAGNATGVGTGDTGISIIGLSNPTTGDNAFYVGELQHLIVWNRTLSATEVGYLARAALAGVPYQLGTYALTGNYVQNILQAAGWPSAWQSLNDGTVVPSGIKFAKTALQALQEVATTERSRVFVDRLGNVVFHDRSRDFTDTRATTSQATFSDSGVAGTVPFSAVGQIAYNDQFLSNKVTVNTGDGNGFTVESATSQTTYGIRARSIDTLLSTGEDALTYASVEVQNYKDVSLRIDDWTVLPQTDAATSFPKVLGTRLADRVTFEIKPNNVGTRISESMIVEAIAHEFTPERWSTTYSGSPAVNAWLLEDATYGLLESTTVLG